MKYKDLYVGQKYCLSKCFSAEEVLLFSQLSLDTNPIHIDEDYGQKSIYGKNIVHGLLSGSLFSAIIGTKMPGEGSIYLAQELNFKKPVFQNEMVTAEVEITKLRNDKQLVFLSTICFNEVREVLIEGSAVVKKQD